MTEKTGVQPLTGSGLYEYAFVPVPQSKRKNGVSLFFVLSGFTSTLSCLILGAKIGDSLPFWQAVGACLSGDLVLIFIGTSLGIISARSGWSTAFLAQRILGKSASIVFTLLLLVCTVLWVGVNGSLFSTMIISVFPNWLLPVSTTSILVIAFWAQSASGGWKSLDIASRLVVPCSLTLLFYAMLQVFIRMNGTSFLFTAPISNSMSFSVASTAVIGNYICGCISTPDTCRFARSPKVAAIVCPCAYASGMFLFHVCGVVVAKAGGFSNFNRAASVLGILIPMLICALLCLATTQNMNIYISSLAMQNIFQGTRLEGNVSHKTVVFLMAGVAAALSVSGISNYLVPMVSFFSILMIPLPGMLFGEAFFFHDSIQAKSFDWRTVAIWVAGSCAGFLFLYLNLPIASFWGMLFSGICYVVINKRHRRCTKI